MTNLVTTVAQSEAEIRWQNWEAQGAESDRRTATRMRTGMLLIVAALVVAFLVQLT